MCARYCPNQLSEVERLLKLLYATLRPANNISWSIRADVNGNIRSIFHLIFAFDSCSQRRRLIGFDTPKIRLKKIIILISKSLSIQHSIFLQFLLLLWSHPSLFLSSISTQTLLSLSLLINSDIYSQYIRPNQLYSRRIFLSSFFYCILFYRKLQYLL